MCVGFGGFGLDAMAVRVRRRCEARTLNGGHDLQMSRPIKTMVGSRTRQENRHRDGNQNTGKQNFKKCFYRMVFGHDGTPEPVTQFSGSLNSSGFLHKQTNRIQIIFQYIQHTNNGDIYFPHGIDASTITSNSFSEKLRQRFFLLVWAPSPRKFSGCRSSSPLIFAATLLTRYSL